MINLQNEVNRDKQKQAEAPNGIHRIKESFGKLGAAEMKQTKSQTEYIPREGKSSPTGGCRWKTDAGNQGKINKKIVKGKRSVIHSKWRYVGICVHETHDSFKYLNNIAYFNITKNKSF